MGWLELVALLATLAILGVTVALVLAGPRLWHGASTQRTRRMGGGLGVMDEFWRPHTYEQRIAEERREEAGDQAEGLEPQDQRRPPGDGGSSRPLPADSTGCHRGCRRLDRLSPT